METMSSAVPQTAANARLTGASPRTAHAPAPWARLPRGRRAALSDRTSNEVHRRGTNL
jgi:hypothetical protein